MNRAVWLLAAAVRLLAEDGRAIVEEVQRRSATGSYQYQGALTVTDARGKVTSKGWRYARLGSAGEARTVVRFTSPPDVRGVALLIVNHADRASDQWMWTPLLGRERRIARQDRTTRFLGTDFTFEDLEERDVKQFEFGRVETEELDGVACWRIEGRPRQERHSQYSSLLLWVRKDRMVVVRADSLVNGQAVRRVLQSDFARIGEIWTARVIECLDLKRGSRTRLTMERIKYEARLDEAEFTLEALRHE